MKAPRSFVTATVGWLVALFVAVTVTPVETIALQHLLVVHLLQNVVLAEWAPLLVVLGFSPARPQRDGKYHRLQVKLVPPRGMPPLKVFWRLGYYAPGE